MKIHQQSVQQTKVVAPTPIGFVLIVRGVSTVEVESQLEVWKICKQQLHGCWSIPISHSLLYTPLVAKEFPVMTLSPTLQFESVLEGWSVTIRCPRLSENQVEKKGSEIHALSRKWALLPVLKDQPMSVNLVQELLAVPQAINEK